jgi:predicted alpha/beta superfamily hydrolase
MKKSIASGFSVLVSLLMLSHAMLMGQVGPVINEQKKHVLKSTINGADYHLSVSLPKHYAPAEATRYPVLFLLDGGLGFPVAHSARTGFDLFGDMEEVIIVAIEYEWDKSMSPWFVNRSRDYTPSEDAAFEANPGYAKLFGYPEGSLVTGGGPVFLDVIRKEIIPFVDKNYKTTKDRGISGHSFGGLFVGYCLLTAPELFQRYGINSPSFWWNKKEMFGMEKEFSKRNQSLPVKIFMSVGSLEGNAMTPVMTAFADSLKSRNYQGLSLTTHIFEGETHMSVVPAMISRTLRVLYPAKKE